jgi:hypothetical protein
VASTSELLSAMGLYLMFSLVFRELIDSFTTQIKFLHGHKIWSADADGIDSDSHTEICQKWTAPIVSRIAFPPVICYDSKAMPSLLSLPVLIVDT